MNLIILSILKKIKTLYDFDNLITAPHFNYKNAIDYGKSHAKDFRIIKVKVPLDKICILYGGKIRAAEMEVIEL